MPKCPICGKEVEYLTEHSLYFCSSCNKYFNEKTPQTKSEKKPNDTLMCPYCHSINTGYISDENTYFCRQCGKRFDRWNQTPTINKTCPICNSSMVSYIDENSCYFCSHCRNNFDANGKVIYNSPNKGHEEDDNTGYGVGFALAVFFGLFGMIIVWLMGDSKKGVKRGAKHGCILNLVILVIVVIICAVLAGTAWSYLL